MREEIAEAIRSRADELTKAWVDAVRNDNRIQSDGDLSDGGLIDHIPAMIEEVCDLLAAGEQPSVSTIREARVHSYLRFHQGYRGRDIIAETSLLRMLLFDCLTQYLIEKGTTSIRSLVETMSTINLYIDEEMRYAMTIYTEAIRPTQPPSE